MKIAILQTGDVAANLLAKFGDYPNMFFSLFKRAGKTKSIFSWTVFDVRKDKYPVSPYDARRLSDYRLSPRRIRTIAVD